MLGLWVGLACAGCQSFKGVKRCNQLLTMVNGSLERAKELHDKPPSIENYRQISEIFGQLEAQLVEQSKADDDIERSVKGYAKQMRRIGREARTFAQSLERLEKAEQAGDAEQAKQAHEELRRTRERSARLVEATGNEAKKFREACRPKG